jgi:hypothetical protein
MGVIILSMIFFTSNAFPWGSATHAYIDDKIGKSLPLRNLNEIYGGMAPDIFNFYPQVLDTNSPYFALYMQTHYNTLALWAAAQKATDLGKASAFGFASHANGQLWPPYAYVFAGADFTAHGLSGNDPINGYVIGKANWYWYNVLKTTLLKYGIVLADTTGEAISHNIIEFAIDIMVVYDMPDGSRIGKKMIESVLFRSPEFPLLLVKAYEGVLTGPPFDMSRLEAAKMILSAEKDFRQTMIIYGQGLTQANEAAAINYIAALLAQMGAEIYGITVPQELVAGAIIGAQAVCYDYADAIQDTVGYVKDEMAAAGISYLTAG